jgi:hypothetical protein
MLSRVIRFVRLPILLLLLFAVGRFSLGLARVPYFPRGTAIFSIVVLSLISSFYFGALSGKVGGFGWGGGLLCGTVIGLAAQALIFTATLVSYLGDFNTYFRHWDALNVPEGTVVPMARAMQARAGGLLIGPVFTTIAAALGRSLGALAPEKKS